MEFLSKKIIVPAPFRKRGIETLFLYGEGEKRGWFTRHDNRRSYCDDENGIHILPGQGGMVFYADFKEEHLRGALVESSRRADVDPDAVLQQGSFVMAGAKLGGRVVLANFGTQMGVIDEDCEVGGYFYDFPWHEKSREGDVILHGIRVGSRSAVLSWMGDIFQYLWDEPWDQSRRPKIYLASSLAENSTLKADGLDSNIHIEADCELGASLNMEAGGHAPFLGSSIRLWKGASIGENAKIFVGREKMASLDIAGRVGAYAEISVYENSECHIGSKVEDPQNRRFAQIGSEACIQLNGSSAAKRTVLIVNGGILAGSQVELNAGEKLRVQEGCVFSKYQAAYGTKSHTFLTSLQTPSPSSASGSTPSSARFRDRRIGI